MNIKPHHPAYPTHTCDESSLSCGGTYTYNLGLTKREHFAALALQGILASRAGEADSRSVLQAMCADAVDIADILIAALNKENTCQE